MLTIIIDKLNQQINTLTYYLETSKLLTSTVVSSIFVVYQFSWITLLS